MPPLSETISRKAPRVIKGTRRQLQTQLPLTTPNPEHLEPQAETEVPAGPIPQPEQEWLGLMMERLSAEK